MGILSILFLLTASAAEPGCETLDVDAAASGIYDAWVSVGDQEALERFKLAEGRLDCLRRFDQEDLTKFYLRGAEATLEFDPQMSAALIAEAARLGGSMEPTFELTASVLRDFQARRLAQRDLPQARIEARTPIVLDGNPMGAGESAELPAGWHLLQDGSDATKVADRIQVDAGTLLVARRTPRTAGLRAAAVATGAALVAGGATVLAVPYGSAQTRYGYGSVDEREALRATVIGLGATGVAMAIAGVGLAGFGAFYSPEGRVELAVSGTF